MQGMMWLYAKNVIFLEQHYYTRHVLEYFVLKTNFKGHAQTCLLIVKNSVVYPPMVSSI